MTPNRIQFSSTWVMRITADRRIEVNADVEVTKAAQDVLDALQHLLKPAPVHKPWVGLTDEEISASSKGHMTRNGFARTIEAKLRSRNT